MKKRNIMIGVLALSVLVASNYNMHSNTIKHSTNENIVYAEKNQKVSDEDLKKDAIKAVKDYFGKSPNLNKMKLNVITKTKEQKITGIDEKIKQGQKTLETIKSINIDDIKNVSVKEENDSLEKFKYFMTSNLLNIKETEGMEKAKKQLNTYIKSTEDSIKRFQNMKINVRYGTTYLYFESKEETYNVNFDCKTRELLSVNHEVKLDESKIKSKNLISIEDAKNKAKEFLVKNKLDNIQNPKLVKQEEFQAHLQKDKVGGGFNFNSVALVYEDGDKKANIIVDRATGDISGFDIGKAANKVTYKTSPN